MFLLQCPVASYLEFNKWCFWSQFDPFNGYCSTLPGNPYTASNQLCIACELCSFPLYFFLRNSQNNLKRYPSGPGSSQMLNSHNGMSRCMDYRTAVSTAAQLKQYCHPIHVSLNTNQFHNTGFSIALEISQCLFLRLLRFTYISVFFFFLQYHFVNCSNALFYQPEHNFNHNLPLLRPHYEIVCAPQTKSYKQDNVSCVISYGKDCIYSIM